MMKILVIDAGCGVRGCVLYESIYLQGRTIPESVTWHDVTSLRGSVACVAKSQQHHQQ